MTDFNTQMTPEAMMQAEIERLKCIIAATNHTWTDEMHRLDAELADAKAVSGRLTARAEKAERELAEHRAQTDALIADVLSIFGQKVTGRDTSTGEALFWGDDAGDCLSPADAIICALEARDRAMRNVGVKKVADAVWIVTTDYYAAKIINLAILSLIEKEPEGKGDE